MRFLMLVIMICIAPISSLALAAPLEDVMVFGKERSANRIGEVTQSGSRAFRFLSDSRIIHLNIEANSACLSGVRIDGQPDLGERNSRFPVSTTITKNPGERILVTIMQSRDAWKSKDACQFSISVSR